MQRDDDNRREVAETMGFGALTEPNMFQPESNVVGWNSKIDGKGQREGNG